MEILGTKVEIINDVSGTPEASVRVANTTMTLEETELAVLGLSRVVALALDHHDKPTELSYVAKTDVKL